MSLLTVLDEPAAEAPRPEAIDLHSASSARQSSKIQATKQRSRQLSKIPRTARQRGGNYSGQKQLEVNIWYVHAKLSAQLSGKAISNAVQSSSRRELIDRLFSIPAVDALRINLRSSDVQLEFDNGEISPPEIKPALAAAMLGARPPKLPLPHERAILEDDGPSVINLRRVGTGLTLWQIDAPSSRFFRITHPLLRFDYVRKAVLDELSTLSDVILRSIYLPLPGNSSVLVFGRPHRLDAEFFREVLDPVLTQALASAPVRPIPDAHDMVVNANLALAPITDFLFPPLGVANVIFTATLAAGYVPAALTAWRQKKFNLEQLYLVITALTLGTYEFLPAALMYWLMRFWPRRSRALYGAQQARFLARYRLRPRRVWVDRGETALETRVEDLTSANIITLNPGDIVPGDGQVVGGSGRLDERLLTGEENPVSKQDGSEIYAASRLLEGSLRIKINSLGEDTAAGRLARWHTQAQQKHPVESVARKNAEKTVLPVFIASGLAALHGGLAAAKAVIRPDYATGPVLSEDLGRLAATIRAANEGILIARNAPLASLLGPISIVLDDSVSWQLPELGDQTFVELALQHGVEELAFFSNRLEKKTADLAAQLGFRSFYGGSSTVAKLAYIAQQQSEGHTVVYVGDSLLESAAAAQANVAISVFQPPFNRLVESDFALLSPDLLKLLQLRAIAATTIEDVDTAFRISLAPNVAAVAAAFLFAAPVYVSVLLTNLGTLANSIKSEGILHLEQSRVRVRS